MTEDDKETAWIVGFAGLVAGAILSATTKYGLTLGGTALGTLVFAFVGISIAASDVANTKDGKRIAGLVAILVLLAIVVITTAGPVPISTGSFEDNSYDAYR